MKYTYELDSLKRFKYLKPAEDGDTPTIEINKADFRNIICGFHGLVNGQIKEVGFTNEEKQTSLNHQLTHEKEEILKWLADNDWKVNKIIVGEWAKDDPRWIEYITQRQEKRTRLEQIESVL